MPARSGAGDHGAPRCAREWTSRPRDCPEGGASAIERVRALVRKGGEKGTTPRDDAHDPNPLWTWHCSCSFASTLAGPTSGSESTLQLPYSGRGDGAAPRDGSATGPAPPTRAPPGAALPGGGLPGGLPPLETFAQLSGLLGPGLQVLERGGQPLAQL